MMGFIQEVVFDNFDLLEHDQCHVGFGDSDEQLEFRVSGFFNGCNVDAISESFVKIIERKATSCAADAKSEPSVGNAVTTREQSESAPGVSVDSQLAACCGEFRGRWSSNEYSPSGFSVGKKIRAKDDDVDSKSESSVSVPKNQAEIDCDFFVKSGYALYCEEHISGSTSNEYSPSGFFLGKKFRASDYYIGAKSEPSVGVSREQSESFQLTEIRSRSNEYSPSGFLVGREIRVTGCDADAESEPSVGNAVTRERSEDARGLSVIRAEEYDINTKSESSVGVPKNQAEIDRNFFVESGYALYCEEHISGSTSNEYSPSGFFLGKKFRAADYYIGAKSEPSVGVKREQSESFTFTEIRSTSNEYSPSGRTVRVVDCDADAESEPSVGNAVMRERSEDAREVSVIRTEEYDIDAKSESSVGVSMKEVEIIEITSTSYEFSPSGFFVGQKLRPADNDTDTKSEPSVGDGGFAVDSQLAEDYEEFEGKSSSIEYSPSGFYSESSVKMPADDEAESSPVYIVSEDNDRNVSVPEEQSEGSEKQVCNLKRKAAAQADSRPVKRRIVFAARDFPDGCGVGNSGVVKKGEEEGTDDDNVGGK